MEMKKIGYLSSFFASPYATLQQGLEWRIRRARLHIQFARAWLYRLTLRNTTFIGITGSAGKTTTKELAVTILSSTYPCQGSMLSRNMPTHVADTVLATQHRHRFSVIEMSGGEPGEISFGIKVAQPSIAALTIIGRDHYSAFKSVEAIAAEKGKLIKSLPAAGTAVLNIDDPLIREIGENSSCNIIWVGFGHGATIRLLEHSSNWPEPLKLVIEYEGKIFTLNTQLHGAHLALSVLTALGIAVAGKMPLEQAIRALGQARPTIGRMQLVEDGKGVHFVRDDFKSPHWTLSAPLGFMASAQAPRKVVVIGSISDSPRTPRRRYHKAALEARQVAELVVFVGRDAHHALRARKSDKDNSIQTFPDVKAASSYLDKVLQPGDLVLLKGSNKTDHLGRIFLNRKSPIQCWVDTCRNDIFCQSCPRLFQEMQNPDNAGSRLEGQLINNNALLYRAIPMENQNCIQVVIGLGNKGTDKQWTRHNIGFRVVDHLAKMFNGVWDPMPGGMVSLGVLQDGKQIILFKPSSVMNKIGDRIKSFLDHQKMSAANIMIVHDDVDLEHGTVRARLGGGDGGHNGVYSIIRSLSTNQFGRIRVGVRTPGDKDSAGQLVLKEFSPDQEDKMDSVLQLASEKILTMLSDQEIQIAQSRDYQAESPVA